MKWASTATEEPRLDAAIEACVSSLLVDLAGELPDLVLVFVSPHFAPQFHHVPPMVRELIGSAALVGCSGLGVIGDGREIEGAPGVAMSGAVLPNVQLHPFHLDAQALPDADAPPEAWEQLVGVSAREEPHFLLLVDPFTFPAEALVTGLDFAFPSGAKVGGLVSGGTQPGNHALYLDDTTYHDGAVGLALWGDIVVDTVIAQGCRPIGRPMVITRAQENLLLELDGRPPVEVLLDLVDSLCEEDRQLARRSLFLGMVMDPLKDTWDTGDFLIRNLVGYDPNTGALAVGERLREGQTVQFHLRDARTSAGDLERQLARYASQSERPPAAGAVLFSCTGRGVGLYGQPDHDSRVFQSIVGQVPLGGFFGNGEIGPVTGTTYLHGYTSSFGIFRPKYPGTGHHLQEGA